MTIRKPIKFEQLERREMLTAMPWGAQAKLIGQDLVAQRFPGLTGAGETVVVIDSGVAYTHPALAGKYAGGWDFASNDSNPWPDSNPHGTGVATMIAANAYDFKGYHYQGIAPGVKIIALREVNSYGADAALKWVVANKAKYNITAVNMTDWGGGTRATFLSMQTSMKTLGAMNVLISIPSGNSGTGAVVPVYGGGEVAVGSTNSWGGIAGSTTRGAALAFLAPAEKITLPYYYGGPIYTDAAVGTSWAAPQIAGATAILRQIDPAFTNAQIKSILTQSGTKTYDSVTRLTFPRLNLYAAVLLAYQMAGKPVPNLPAPAPDPTPTPTPTPTPPPVVVAPTTLPPLADGTVLQTEDFDAGAPGVAYRELDPKNWGGVNYRTGTGVDIVATTDLGSTRAVGGNRATEWLKYTVNVTSAGTYTAEFRVASKGDGGKFHLEVDGVNVTGAMSAGNSGDWNEYTSVLKSGINLTAGKHTLKLVFDAIGGSGGIANFNLMKFTKAVVATPVATPAAAPATTTSPFATVNLTPGVANRIQAENFDIGPRGTAYYDTDTINTGGKYRTNTGVDIDLTNDVAGGYMVGATKAGEWMNYTVNVTKAGIFNIDVREATQYTGGKFHIAVDGHNVSGSMTFTNTGSFIRWSDVSKSGIGMSAGKHIISIVIESTGNGPVAANINWIKVS